MVVTILAAVTFRIEGRLCGWPTNSDRQLQQKSYDIPRYKPFALNILVYIYMCTNDEYHEGYR